MLAYKKQRSLTLLRSLSFNITKKPDVLHMKQISDLMFSMANLNFYDENLLARLSNDIQKVLHDGEEKKFVVSIATSLGFLKYKDNGSCVFIGFIYSFPNAVVNLKTFACALL